MQLKNLSAARKQFGLTLVEALSFLAIFGVVAAGAVSMFGSTSDAAKVNLIAGEVNALKTVVKARALAGTPYGSIDMESLKTGGALSTNIRAVSGSGASSKGTMADGTGFVITGNTSDYSIEVSGLSDEICDSVRISLASSGATNTPACASGAISFTYK